MDKPANLGNMALETSKIQMYKVACAGLYV